MLGTAKKKLDFNMVQTCYNQNTLKSEFKSICMQPGKQDATFPSNLFNSWLDMREAKGQSRAEVIREVNAKLDRKYDNNIFYKWKKQKKTLAEPVLLEVINPELPQVLMYIYETNNIPSTGVDFDLLAEVIKPAVKDLSII